jgi:hypothetical protein
LDTNAIQVTRVDSYTGTGNATAPKFNRCSGLRLKVTDTIIVAIGHEGGIINGPSHRCRAVEWHPDGPNPGGVEVQFIDAEGVLWRLRDKAPMFASSDTRLTPTTAYPVVATGQTESNFSGDRCRNEFHVRRA